MKKNLIIGFLLVMFLIVVSGCGKTNPSSLQEQNNDKLPVAVSFQAMKEITEAVGKDHVEVNCVIPDGTEPHDFQPTAKDLTIISKSKLFIYNGLGLEKSWLDKVTAADDNKGLTLVEASKGATPMMVAEDNSDSKVTDPHFWLSVEGAKLEAKNIRDALIAADGKNKADYEKNYQEFAGKLDDLKKEYTEKFQNSKRHDFVTGHAAFGYLARDFNLKQNSVSDALLSGEPSAKKLKELTDYCRQNNVTTIFVEDMVNPKISETLATEVNAKTVKIYTLESSPDNLDYISALRYDLDKIYESLNS